MSGHKLKTYLGVSGVVGLVIVLHFVGALKFVENFFRELVAPVSRELYQISVKVGENDEIFRSVEDLQKAYTENVLENNRLRVTTAEVDRLRNENNILRQSLNFFTSTTFETIGADVIGKNLDPIGSTIIINRGSNDNVAVGNPVVAENGVFVGKVARVEDRQAVVRLVNDNQSRVAATVMSRDKSIGIVEGGYGISIRLNFIPQNETLSVGDIVVTSGLESGIPRGLALGRVEAVEKESYQPFQQAVLTPLVSLDKLSVVSVINKIEYR